MRKLLFSIFMLAGLQAFSQIPVIKYSNAFSKNSQNYNADDADTAGIHPGNGGANVIWDFSSLKRVTFSHTSGSCINNQHADHFPNANLQLTLNGNTNLYFTGDGTNITCYGSKSGYGAGALAGDIYHIYDTDPQILWSYPITYNSTNSDKFSGTYSYILADNSTTVLSGTTKGSYDYVADGYGKLKIMNSTVNYALRLKVHTVTNDSAQVSGKPLKITTDQTDYVWMVSGIKSPILKISMIKTTKNGKDSLSKEISYDISDSLSGIKQASTLATSLNLYPNPTSGQFRLSFDADESGNADICIMNQLGQTVKMIPSQAYRMGLNNININLDGVAKGIYFVRLSNGDKSNVSKISVE